MGMNEFLPALLGKMDRFLDIFQEIADSFWDWEYEGPDGDDGEPVPVPEEVPEKLAA